MTRAKWDIGRDVESKYRGDRTHLVPYKCPHCGLNHMFRLYEAEIINGTANRKCPETLRRVKIDASVYKELLEEKLNAVQRSRNAAKGCGCGC